MKATRKKINKFLLKSIPYTISIIVGLAIYLLAIDLNDDIKSLLINISAAFLGIPLIFLFYNVAQNLSKKRLNREIFDYAKMQCDREILSIINQLTKIVHTLEVHNFSQRDVNKLLKLKIEELKKILLENKYLGFQVFKNWDVSENSLHDTLKNSYVLSKLGDDQIIALISIIKSLRALESIQKVEDLYIKTDEQSTSHKVVSGKELNKDNIQFPNRYLLLLDLGDKKFQVADFGDIPKYNLGKLLDYYTINEKYIDIYVGIIHGLLKDIIIWCDTTGGDFIVDSKMFRPSATVKNEHEM